MILNMNIGIITNMKINSNREIDYIGWYLNKYNDFYSPYDFSFGVTFPLYFGSFGKKS